MKKSLIIFGFAMLVFSCKKTEPKTVDTLKTIKDTIVSIVTIHQIENQNLITNEIAVSTLNNYFKSKGFLIQSEIDQDLNIQRLPKNKGKQVIDFVEVKWFTNQLGLISYFNLKPGEVGHCVQPHYALLSNAENGFAISNEEFLPTNFIIDSLKTIEGKRIIYANNYDCHTHKVLKKYKIEIK